MEADASAAGPDRIEFDRTVTSEAVLLAALGRMGVRMHGAVAHDDHDPGGPLGANSELIFALLSGALLIAGFLVSWLTEVPAWLPLALDVGADGLDGQNRRRCRPCRQSSALRGD